MTALSVHTFDYSTLDASTATLAKSTAETIHRHQRRLVADLLDIGDDLIRVKDALGHGSFGAWLDYEFGWTERTAQRYMQAAAMLGAKSDTVSHLPPTVIYRLTAPSTPQHVRDDIVRRLDQGDEVSPAYITNLISKARQQEQQEREDAKLSPQQRKYRAKKKAEREQEKQRLGEEQRQRQERAKATAQKLVDEIGLTTVKRIIETDWEVQAALRVIVLGADHG